MPEPSHVCYSPIVAAAMKPLRAYELVIELQSEIVRIRADNFAFQAANNELRTQLHISRQLRYDLEDMIINLRVRLGELERSKP